MQQYTDKIISQLMDIEHKAYGSSDNIFNIFFHLLFIKSIFKLNIDPFNPYKQETGWENINSKAMKEYILNTTIPILSESLNENIKSYLWNSFRVFQDVVESDLREIYNTVDEIPLETMNCRERYKFVECILDRISSHSRSSIISERTPKVLRDFMTAILNPKSSNEIIGDLSCGTGALLLSAYFNTDNERANYGPVLHGIDINREMYHTFIMHSYISGLHDIKIEQRNILKEFEPERYKFDKIYGNAPFGIRVRPEEISPSFTIQSRSADVLFLEATMESLQKNGKSAVIVSANVLSSASIGNIEIRKRLLESMHIEAVISLPVKHTHSHVPLALIVFKNIKNNAPVLFMDLNRDIDLKKSKGLVDERLKEGNSLYHAHCDSGYDTNCDKGTGQIKDLCWYVEKEQIRNNDYLLDISFHRPHVEEKTLPIKNLLDLMELQLFETLENIKRIKGLTEDIKRIENNSYGNYKLEDICGMRSGRPLPRIEGVEEGELPWIQIRDITKSTSFEIKNAEKSISYEFAQQHHLAVVEAGTVLISVRGTLGTTAIAGTKICIGPNIIALNIIDHKVNPWYLLSWFHKRKSMFEANIQGAIPMISMAMLRNIAIEIPNIEDQSVYADFYAAMNRIQDIKKLSQTNNIYIDQMQDSLFDQYFQ